MEIKTLKENYAIVSPSGMLSLLPNRSYESIVTKANKLNINYNISWTEEDIDKFKNLYPYKNNKDLSIILNRSMNSILALSYKLRIHKDTKYYETNKNLTKDILIDVLIRFAKDLGKTPSTNDINYNKDMPGAMSYYRHFGSYIEACKMAGLAINNNIMGKTTTILYSKNNDLCFSKSELRITNYFIDNNIIYEKEVLYKDIIKDNNCGLKRCDWVVGDNIIVEFFGLPEKNYYRNRMEEKIKLCEDNNFSIISLYRKDLSYIRLNNIFKDYINS